MRRLILMRHAKSDWSAEKPDMERGLNDRGQRSAKALGDWLRAEELDIDQVVCSAATRTQETKQGLELADDVKITLSKELYLAEPEVMLQMIQGQSAPTVLMIAHNPGSALLALSLVSDQPQHDQFSKYPSGATLVVDFDVEDWSEVAPHTGTCHRFVVPRELPQMDW